MKDISSPYIPEQNYYRMPRQYFDLWLTPDELSIVCLMMSRQYNGREYDDTYPQMIQRINISQIRLQTALKTLRKAGLVTHRHGRGRSGEVRSYYRLVPLPEDPAELKSIALKLAMSRPKKSRGDLSTLSTVIHKPSDHINCRPPINVIGTTDQRDRVLINPFINHCINRGTAVDNSSACSASECIQEAPLPLFIRLLKKLKIMEA